MWRIVKKRVGYYEENIEHVNNNDVTAIKLMCNSIYRTVCKLLSIFETLINSIWNRFLCFSDESFIKNIRYVLS